MLESETAKRIRRVRTDNRDMPQRTASQKAKDRP